MDELYARSLVEKGKECVSQKEFTGAIKLYKKALALYIEDGNEYNIARTIERIAKVYEEMEELDPTLEKTSYMYYEQAMDIYKRGYNEKGNEDCLYKLGKLVHKFKKYEDELEFLDITEKLSKEKNQGFVAYNLYLQKIDLLLYLGRDEETKEPAETYIKVREGKEKYETYYSIAMIYMKHGRFNEAIEVFKKAKAEYEKEGRIYGVQGCNDRLCKCYVGINNVNKAKALSNEIKEYLMANEKKMLENDQAFDVVSIYTRYIDSLVCLGEEDEARTLREKRDALLESLDNSEDYVDIEDFNYDEDGLM